MKQPLTRHFFHEYKRCKQRYWSLINKEIESPGLDQEAEFFKKQSSLLKNLAQQYLSQKADCSYERNKEIIVGQDLKAVVDLYETHHKFGKTAIFEIRKAKKIKSHHIWDLAYLAHVFIEAGEPLRKMFIVHFDSDYVLEGEEIEPEKALKIVDVSRKVYKILPKIAGTVKEVLTYAQGPRPSTSLLEHSCRSKDCAFIQKYHPNLPEFSIFDYKGINKEERLKLLEKGILNIQDIPEQYVSSKLQKAQKKLAERQEALIDQEALRNWLKHLKYPLYFLDYEALTSAIPVYPGTQTFQHIVFQYSLHRIESPGAAVEHFEYLPKDRRFPLPDLLADLNQHLREDEGSVMVYHDSFEKSRHREMAVFCPEYADWLIGINERIVDLEKVFMLGTGAYQHPQFYGKTSLKKVLPVLLPDAANHSELDISDGMAAAIHWFDYLSRPDFSEENVSKMRKELLAYCQLDTLAMVQLFQFLQKII